MRGSNAVQEALFMFSKLDDFVSTDHPLRTIQSLVNESLSRLNGLFNNIYADTGRASVAHGKLMRALLLQVFYAIRSERQLMEQIRYNLLSRCFAGSWGWRSTIRWRITRCSPIATSCSSVKWSRRSSPK